MSKSKETSTQDIIDNRVEENKIKILVMLQADEDAKKNKTLVGRYVSDHVADGKAFYVVTKVTKQTCTLDHIEIGDSWTLPFVEILNRVVPKKWVKGNITQRDSWATVSKKAKKT
ncbi:MAG: hypothetical protein E2O29_01740 [Deltaproteobacteria bacterium]|nr:MAG: hypothetical protein E2O29_01740 [Deltaproteobacteria bacterium]